MDLTCGSTGKRNPERGISVILVAMSILGILGMAALSVDLAGLYVEKSEAQRAADAGALAGAQVFATSGCTLDARCLSSGVEATSTTNATRLAQQNLIFGQTPTVPAPTFAAGGGKSTDPLITVTAQAPARTFFIPLSSGATISATATAEAYNPSGSTSGPVICASCLKPFFVPNCDPNHPGTAPPNTLCTPVSGVTPVPFFSGNQIVNGTSIVGESWQLHFQGAGGTTAVPSQWLEVRFDTSAPSCSGGNSATAFQASVTQCATNEIQCGQQLCTLNGKSVGPNDKAVCQLIAYNGGGCNARGGSSSDSITCTSGVCTMTAGSGNPFAARGQTITQSSALVAVPVYDGTPQPGGGAVTVVGYMQLFLQQIQHMGNDDIVTAVIVSATTCGATGGGCSTAGGGSGTSGTASGGGSTLIPVRLVHQ